MTHEPNATLAARVVVLAAGRGTRMKSRTAKVLHPLGGRPFIEHCLQQAQQASAAPPIVVVHPDAADVQEALDGQCDVAFQAEQLGTGHAVRMAELTAADATDVIVMYADMPLIRAETMQQMLRARRETGAAVAMTTLVTPNARGFGRIARDSHGAVQAIVEEVDCSPEQLAIQEVNVGLYCFDGAWMWDALRRVRANPRKGEYFLTDLAEIAIADGRRVTAVISGDADEFIGINTRVDLADAELALRRRVNRAHMLNGVTITDPATTYIEPGVEIGMDTTILPNTHLLGGTRIGENCVIGPDSLLRDAVVGDDCHIEKSVVLESTLAAHVHMGPFSRLRPGCTVHENVHIGNFAEAKNSSIGAGTHIGHFSYMGDTECGPDVNYGAGAITCNYDGKNKNRTRIGAGAFVGSDTLLIAPVEMGERARTGAGSVVTKNVPDDSLAVGAPARVIRRHV
jgi:bifunctional UDP-N-acetylglucosamine pyrophosphorylase/glucosamine-1-phosphate N-acetyltransferase